MPTDTATTETDPPGRVTLHGLEGELLARSERGDGCQAVLKVELDETPAVIKLYGRKRDWLRDSLRDLGQRFVVGKSGMTPAARHRTERATLALWRAHGFDVPADLDLPLPPEVPKRRLVSEWVPGQLLSAPLGDPQVPLAEKQRLLARLAREFARRHELAVRLREPRLVQVHASLDHVLYVQAGPETRERLVSFDFEVTWDRPHSVPRLIERELMQLLQSIAAIAPHEQARSLIAAFVQAYPARELLPRDESAARVGLRRRQQRSRRKLEVLRHVQAALEVHEGVAAGCEAERP